LDDECTVDLTWVLSLPSDTRIFYLVLETFETDFAASIIELEEIFDGGFSVLTTIFGTRTFFACFLDYKDSFFVPNYVGFLLTIELSVHYLFASRY
jgi:hypothetical protein